MLQLSMNTLTCLLCTISLPAYLKLSLTEEKELIRLAIYATKVKSFEYRINSRCKNLAEAYSSGNTQHIISALRDNKSGITPKELSQITGIPLITCRRDLNKIYYFYKALHVRQCLGKIKSPDIPSML